MKHLERSDIGNRDDIIKHRFSIAEEDLETARIVAYAQKVAQKWGLL